MSGADLPRSEAACAQLQVIASKERSQCLKACIRGPWEGTARGHHAQQAGDRARPATGASPRRRCNARQPQPPPPSCVSGSVSSRGVQRSAPRARRTARQGRVQQETLMRGQLLVLPLLLGALAMSTAKRLRAAESAAAKGRWGLDEPPARKGTLLRPDAPPLPTLGPMTKVGFASRQFYGRGCAIVDINGDQHEE